MAANIILRAWERLVRARNKVRNLKVKEERLRHGLERILVKINNYEAQIQHELQQAHHLEHWYALKDQLNEIEFSISNPPRRD